MSNKSRTQVEGALNSMFPLAHSSLQRDRARFCGPGFRERAAICGHLSCFIMHYAYSSYKSRIAGCRILGSITVWLLIRCLLWERSEPAILDLGTLAVPRLGLSSLVRRLPSQLNLHSTAAPSCAPTPAGLGRLGNSFSPTHG